eukprot:UC4_evm1s1453
MFARKSSRFRRHRTASRKHSQCDYGSGFGKQVWMTPELMSMFLWIYVSPLSIEEEFNLLKASATHVPPKKLMQLVKFAQNVRESEIPENRLLSGSLSTRQLQRLVKRLEADPDLGIDVVIKQACLERFMPDHAKIRLAKMIESEGITTSKKAVLDSDIIEIKSSATGPSILHIGELKIVLQPPKNSVLVPDIVFYDNPIQTKIIKAMIIDFRIGQNLLLIGNQGVGKNKLADKMLQILQLPREYIQLHRDSTINDLTSYILLKNGVLVYEDSPLVNAARNGYVLVVDEADKAPTGVIFVLKSLIA